jgi:hypothetical protein
MSKGMSPGGSIDTQSLPIFVKKDIFGHFFSRISEKPQKLDLSFLLAERELANVSGSCNLLHERSSLMFKR